MSRIIPIPRPLSVELEFCDKETDETLECDDSFFTGWLKERDFNATQFLRGYFSRGLGKFTVGCTDQIGKNCFERYVKLYESDPRYTIKSNFFLDDLGANPDIIIHFYGVPFEIDNRSFFDELKKKVGRVKKINFGTRIDDRSMQNGSRHAIVKDLHTHIPGHININGARIKVKYEGQPSRNKNCYICQQSGHEANACLNQPYCTTCQSTGHSTNYYSCPNRTGGPRELPENPLTRSPNTPKGPGGPGTPEREGFWEKVSKRGPKAKAVTTFTNRDPTTGPLPESEDNTVPPGVPPDGDLPNTIAPDSGATSEGSQPISQGVSSPSPPPGEKDVPQEGGQLPSNEIISQTPIGASLQNIDFKEFAKLKGLQLLSPKVKKVSPSKESHSDVTKSPDSSGIEASLVLETHGNPRHSTPLVQRSDDHSFETNNALTPTRTLVSKNKSLFEELSETNKDGKIPSFAAMVSSPKQNPITPLQTASPSFTGPPPPPRRRANSKSTVCRRRPDGSFFIADTDKNKPHTPKRPITSPTASTAKEGRISS